MSQWTVTGILASVQRRGFLPTGDETFSAADFMAILDEELRGYVLPFIRECNEELLIRRYDVSSIPSDGRVRLGERFGVESVKAVYGSTDGGVSYFPLSRLEPEEASRYQTGTGQGCWYFEDDFVCLVGTPVGYTHLRLTYYLRPSTLCLETAAAQVSSLNGGRTVITATADTTAALSGTAFDVVSGRPGLRILNVDAAGTASGSTITFSSAVDSAVVAGDFVCMPGTSPVPNIPADLLPLLVQRAVCVCLGAKNDVALGQHQARLGQMEASARSAFTVRSQGTPRFINSPLTLGPNRRNRWFR